MSQDTFIHAIAIRAPLCTPAHPGGVPGAPLATVLRWFAPSERERFETEAAEVRAGDAFAKGNARILSLSRSQVDALPPKQRMGALSYLGLDVPA